LARALADGAFALVAEVASPRGFDLSGAVAEARQLRDRGADAINVPDYPRSGGRASALTLAARLEQEPIESLLHYTCRARTLMTMQSDLIGAHALGVRNVLLTTGALAAQAGYADATSGFDVDAIGLVNMVVRLNQGLDIAGQPIGLPTQFHIGVAVNPFAPSPEAEWRRLAHKVEAGAEFLVTPPILDVDAFEAELPKLLETGLPVLASVAALDGLRHAEFLASEVAGVRVAAEYYERLRQAPDEVAEAEAITAEIIERLRDRVQGRQITSFPASATTAARVLERFRATPGRLTTVEGASHV
jgi:5,10-methylenetetrahydrofolate reductase